MVKLSLPHPIPITNPTSPFRNFNFMRPIKIVGSDTDLHDYQVRIHLDRSNFPLEKCKPDGSDIRFRDDSGEILPYWIERWNTAEGVIWCKIPFIPAESSKFIWMIYGNPNAKSESNGNAVFEMFDVQGIVGFWHFDEPQWTGAAGEVKDETGVNHGTAYGGATTTSDAIYGRAGYFDGIGGYVDCGKDDSLDITDNLTLEVWVNPQEQNSDGLALKQIAGRASQYVLYINRNDLTLSFYTYPSGSANSLVSTISLIKGNFYHVVVTLDENGKKLYINGELNNSNSIAGTQSIVRSFGIGGDPMNTPNREFNGIIDEVRIWERALTLTEIQILYNNYMQKMGSYFNVRKYVTPAPVVIV